MYKYLLLLLPTLLFGLPETTLAIIKPNAVSHKHVGAIINRYEEEQFRIDNLKMALLTKEQAEEFYKEHRERPFFERLTTFMSSGPIVVLQLTAENGVEKNRELIGSTDPAAAAPNTLRALYGQSKERNSLHGSDSYESAQREIRFFFG